MLVQRFATLFQPERISGRRSVYPLNPLNPPNPQKNKFLDPAAAETFAVLGVIRSSRISGKVFIIRT
jgi:hypothetical protein